MPRKIEPSSLPLHHSALRLKGEQEPLNVYGSGIATEAANEILCDVLKAISRGPDDDLAVRDLSRLAETHDWVLRVGELHDYLNRLVRRRRDEVVRRIINDDRRPGPRHKSKVYLVHLMRAMIAGENEEGRDCSRARGAKLVAERFGRDLGLSAESIEADYCRYQHEYDRLRAGQFIGAEWLATRKWQPK